MVAPFDSARELAPLRASLIAVERDVRRPDCDKRCTVVRALIPGVFGRSELLLHDPDAHVEYGRLLAGPDVAPRVLVTGPLSIDLRSLVVRLDGMSVHLAEGELRLLMLLAGRAGVAVEVADIMRALWPTDDVSSFRILRHSLDAVVFRLRQRLRHAGGVIARAGFGRLRLDIYAPDAAIPDVGRGIRGGRWALNWDACRRCGRVSVPHNGRGYCVACYARLRDHEELA